MRGACAAIAAFLLMGLFVAPAWGAGEEPLALVGGKVFVDPESSPIEDGVVMIRGDRIVAVGEKAAVEVPDEARTLDCTGSTIVAGFWNCHVHFFERKWASAERIPAEELSRQLEETFSRYGFTTVFDLSSDLENTKRIRERIEAKEVLGPRVLTTGEGLIPPGGLPPASVLSVMGLSPTALPEVDGVPSAEAAAKKLLAKDVNGLKLFISSQSGARLPLAVTEAIVTRAHAADRPVFAHPESGADVLTALVSGVDVVAHTTPSSGAWDAAVLAEVTKRSPALTPTLALWQHMLRHDRLSIREERVDIAIEQLRAWIDAGGAVIFGTDLGAVDPDPSTEYALMARAGMTFETILGSLTTEPARRLGDADLRGRIAVGQLADLVILGGDPSADLGALSRVRTTLRTGRVVYRRAKTR